jgi:hypothetical protein
MIARLAGVLVLLLAASIAQAQNKVPAELALEALVKASLLSFNDANITGNYTVFHARLSKPFREQFPPERLKETFKDFSQKHIDIHVVAAFKPTYYRTTDDRSRRQAAGEGLFPDRAGPRQLRAGLHPFRCRMADGPDPRQAGRPILTSSPSTDKAIP